MGGRAESVGVEAVNDKALAARMLGAAISYHDDAEFLKQSTESGGDGRIQLQILSIEIVLKCVRLLDVGVRNTRKGGHDYASIWAELSPTTQSFVLSAANERAQTTLDTRSVASILSDLQRVFELARYPYDLLANESEVAIFKRGREWEAVGSPLDKADFRFHPEEMMTLFHGLRTWAEDRLS